MPANNPQAYWVLLLLAVPAVVYYFVVNKDIKKSSLYIVTFFGSLFVIKFLANLFNIGSSFTALNTALVMTIVNVIVATLLALFLLGDKLDLKNVGWLAGIVVAAQIIMSETLKSVTMGFL